MDPERKMEEVPFPTPLLTRDGFIQLVFTLLGPNAQIGAEMLSMYMISGLQKLPTTAQGLRELFAEWERFMFTECASLPAVQLPRVRNIFVTGIQKSLEGEPHGPVRDLAEELVRAGQTFDSFLSLFHEHPALIAAAAAKSVASLMRPVLTQGLQSRLNNLSPADQAKQFEVLEAQFNEQYKKLVVPLRDYTTDQLHTAGCNIVARVLLGHMKLLPGGGRSTTLAHIRLFPLLSSGEPEQNYLAMLVKTPDVRPWNFHTVIWQRISPPWKCAGQAVIDPYLGLPPLQVNDYIEALTARLLPYRGILNYKLEVRLGPGERGGAGGRVIGRFKISL